MNWKEKLYLYKLLFILMIMSLLTGCAAGQSSFKKGNLALEQQSYDQAVMEYLSALESNPANYQYRLKLNDTKNKAALAHKDQGDNFFARKKYLDALQEYQLATELDGSLYVAVDGQQRAKTYLWLEKLIQEAELHLQSGRQLRAEEAVNRALNLVPENQQALQLKEKIKQHQQTLVDGVELDVMSTQPINLNFHETSLPDVFDILTKLSGINFILDEDVRENKTTLFLEQASFAQALELLLRMNKLDKKILNRKTIILYPKTRDKQKQFEDQIIQTFYLSHIDAKKAVNMLRTMLQVRKIYVQEELNAVVIRDQPDVIRLAQKLIEANDRGSSEVVFDLELIEVNHNDTRELGLKLSNYSIGAGLSLPESGNIVASGLSAGGATTNLIDFSQNLDPFYAIPTASFKMMRTLVDAEVLANPKIRVRNKEKAKVHVGSREPVVTVTINDTQTSENVQYMDVGVKLDVEPTIQLDNTIVTKLGLEVSNVSGREKTANGTAVITISSTNANTTLTLKDGEQTVIGGLIRNDNSVTKNKFPILGDIPLLGELFNGTDKTKSKREILLSITPHIVKMVRVPQGDIASIWSGGEDDLKFGRNFGTFIDEFKAGQESLGAPAELSDQQPTSSTPAVAPDAAEDNSAVAAQLQPALELKPIVSVEGPSRANQGEEVKLSLQVEDMQNLFSAPMTILYDPALLEFVSATEGPFLITGSDVTVFTYTNLKEKGRIVIGLKQGASGQGASGRGELFNLQFKALKAGTTEVGSQQLNFRNKRGGFLETEAYGLLLEIEP